MEVLIGSWLFLLIYGLVCMAVVLIACRWYYGSEIGHLRRTLIDFGELLHKTNEEMASTRKLNVEIAREKEQLNEQIHNQMFTIEAFQKRETLFEKASRDMANKAMQRDSKVDQLVYELDLAVNERDQLRTECQVAVDQRNELREQVIAYCSEIEQLNENLKTQTLTISNLQLGYDRCQDVFKDLSIHLNDMAYEIASVAPNAKGD